MKLDDALALCRCAMSRPCRGSEVRIPEYRGNAYATIIKEARLLGLKDGWPVQALDGPDASDGFKLHPMLIFRCSDVQEAVCRLLASAIPPDFRANLPDVIQRELVRDRGMIDGQQCEEIEIQWRLFLSAKQAKVTGGKTGTKEKPKTSTAQNKELARREGILRGVATLRGEKRAEYLDRRKTTEQHLESWRRDRRRKNQGRT